MNAGWFTQQHDKHYGLLYFWLLNRVRNREAAEDLAALAFEKAWSAKRPLEDPAKFKAWLFAIAAHELAMFRRATRAMIPLDNPEIALNETLADPKDFVQELEKRQAWRQIRQALSLVSEVQRKAVICWARGMSQREAAQAQGIPYMTAGTRLFNSRRALARSQEGANI